MWQSILFAAQIYGWTIVISMAVALLMTVIYRFLGKQAQGPKPPD